MAPTIHAFGLLLATLSVSIDCYNMPEVRYQKQLEPSWQSTETVASDQQHPVISEQFLKNFKAGEAKANQVTQSNNPVSLLQSSLQEDEAAIPALPELEDGQQKQDNPRLFFNNIASFTFAPLQALVSGINGLVQPFFNPIAEISVGGIFPEYTTVYSTYFSSGTQAVTQTFVSTKNSFWTTTTTSVSVTLSSTSTSSTTMVSVSVTTSPSIALLTSSSTASSTATYSSTYTSSSTTTSVSTSTSTSTALTTYSSTESQVSTLVLPTETSVSTTTVTKTVYTSTLTYFPVQTVLSSPTILVCVTDPAQVANIGG